MGKPAVASALPAAERAELAGLANRRRTVQRLARRAGIVLAAADGIESQEIAEVLGADQNTAGKWRRRFAERRMGGLDDEPRSGAPRRIGDDEIAETIRLTLDTTPPAAPHWSLPSNGHDGGSCAFDHSPHLAGFRVATAPDGNLQAVDRPAFRREGPRHRRATWRRPSAQWCCAATRIADPDLRPHSTFVADPRPGQAERSHDDTRHGTLSLFAALDTATGRVIGRCAAPHPWRDFPPSL